ncbi:glucose-fructose oxidoreductase [Altererythrobacter indicus]|uniref:Glucose-fructose oxidoreductase n=1 Tax=Altericroceibacterium indicum TaxID=374177 RepID=A0A845A630_9SPHN|nr:Gfo/Idh/MocA family oxidoreductase [Altericroceibacterium indicum]MXP24723.1 glucose-fructose oxidoreductase [Altericroceibacterium indicum]
MTDYKTSRRVVMAGFGTGLTALAMPALASGDAQPARKLGYAIVGLGYYATQQIMPQFVGCEHARLTALVSGTPEKLERYGAQYGIPKTHRYNYSNFDSIRDNPDIDIVYVVLPNSMHAEYTIRAAQAGKHVMCEKPMAVSVAECEAMISACSKAGKKLMIGYRCHFEPYNLHAIALAKSGDFGPTRIITAEHGFNAKPDQWRLERPLSGGGSLMDIGIYSLNATRYLTGEEPVEVMAMESTDRSDPRFTSVEDRIDFMLRFPSGILANCVSSYSSNHNAYRVTGTKGWVGMEPATSYSGQRMSVNLQGEIHQVTLPFSPKTQFAAQLDHLPQAIASGIEPRTSGAEGLRDMRIIEAIYRSAAERRAITLTAK